MAHFLSHSRDAACESEDMQVLTLVLKLKMLRNYKLGITYYQKGNEICFVFLSRSRHFHHGECTGDAHIEPVFGDGC